ncbi:hypothetical protein [Actinomadura yumaensis]|uniref:Uncharacterized protein n=1 Tax=Actinomadura yumaensis TaxID=111807 RepID=A0ABW2CRC9_9ACTN
MIREDDINDGYNGIDWNPDADPPCRPAAGLPAAAAPAPCACPPGRCGCDSPF